MPTCSIKGCSNSSKKSASMCYMPRNYLRKQQWLANCSKLGGMHDWVPKESTVICESHFSKDAWEKVREDGKKKLKNNALPTIFGSSVLQKKSLKTASKKSEQIDKNLKKTKNVNSSGKKNNPTENRNENLNPKNFDQIYKDPKKNISPKIRIILKKCDPLLKNHIKYNDLNMDTQIIKKPKKNCLKKLVEKQHIDISKKLLQGEYQSKEIEEIYTVRNCKQIHEDLDIAKIITQPSAEAKINYLNIMKNNKKKQSNIEEIYNIKNEKTETRNKSCAIRLVAPDIQLNSVESETLKKILNKMNNEMNNKIIYDKFFEKDFFLMEKSLMEMLRFYKILEPGLHSEQRCGVMQEMYIKSEYLRRIHKTIYKKKEEKMKNYIAKLKKRLFIAHLKSLGMYNNLHRNQIYVKNGRRQRIKQWSDRALNYTTKLKTSCDTKGHQDL